MVSVTTLAPDTQVTKIAARSMSETESRSDDSDSQHSSSEDDRGNDAEPLPIATAPAWESAKASLEARRKRKRSTTRTASLLKAAMEDLDEIWRNTNADAAADVAGEDPGEEQPSTGLPLRDMERIRQTTDLLVKVFTQDIHEPAIRALVTNEELIASKTKLQSELETKQKEIERLRRSEQRSKEAIKNLLKAVNESAEDTKDHSQSKLLEAKMRADLLHAIAERDASQKDALVARRSSDLLAGDVENLKQEKTKLQHDKLRLEREVRSARALADQLSSSLLGSNSHNKDDLDYYKGKSKELEIHLQGMTARLAEKNQEIQELRRCNNRNLSQQKLEALRAAAGGSSIENNNSNSNSTRKRARKSYDRSLP